MSPQCGGYSRALFCKKLLSPPIPVGGEAVVTNDWCIMVSAFASEAGGAGSNPGRVIPKTLKMVPVATLLGAQH